MTVLWMLSRAQMKGIEPHSRLSHGVARVDDRRVISGIIYVIKHGLQWKDAPSGYGPHKTLYNRFVRWSRLGVFNRIFVELAAAREPDRLMIDATHLKAQPACLVLRYAGVRYDQLYMKGQHDRSCIAGKDV